MSVSPAPLSAELVLGRTPSLKEPQLLDGVLYWQEQRPHEGGRTTLMRRRPGGSTEELTPGSWNLRCRVHEYGGGSCAIGRRSDGRAVAVFVNDSDRCLWQLDLDANGASPQPLTPSACAALGGGVIDSQRDRWIGIQEQNHTDQLVVVPLAGGPAQPLHQPADFCGYPALSADGQQLAWVEWQQPWMPWERSQLWLARLSETGDLLEARVVAGSGSSDACAISVFQPIWAGNDLVVANDRSGFWNLERWCDARPDQQPSWQPLLEMEAEFAMPQWVFGMSTHAWDGEQLLASACRQGQWQLGRVLLPGPGEASGQWQPIEQPFTDLAGLCAEAGRLACIASSADQPSGLLELHAENGRWQLQHSPAAPCPMPAEAISRPEQLWFSSHGNQPTQAWYYPPAGGGHPEAPLLVKGHSGPTAMARTGLNLAIQYWTSRGWGVVDVNYGGSTGFGRAYRQRLDGQWGVVDVADCAAAAEALVARGLACRERIAIEGGSAAGFTALAGLCFTETFRAAACRYAVTDLAALTEEGHRFEARYLDNLVGPWPAAKATYDARSPLQHADRIRCPVIFFQGLDDVVVPPQQTERMAEALRQRGIPVEVRLFEGEGHGFRSGAVQQEVLESSERFFRQQFGLNG